MSAPSFFSFSNLAKISTGRAPILKGLLPPLGTMAALLATALVISGGWWFWAGASTASALFLPFYAKTFFAVCGVTIFNFVFQREIQYTIHGGIELIEKGFFYDEENLVEPKRLVDDLVLQLNKYFRKKYGDEHVDMPAPRLALFESEHFKIETTLGMSPWESQIMFGGGTFCSHHSKMNQRHLAAILTKELVKIYMRRGSSNVVVKMGVDMLSTLQELQEAHSFFKALGILVWPLQFLFLAEHSIKRSYEFEACQIVADYGRGSDLHDYFGLKHSPMEVGRPNQADLKSQREAQKRSAYDGRFKFVLAPIHKWVVDHLENPSDHHQHSIWFVALSGLIGGGARHFKALYKGVPSSIVLKEFMLSELEERDGVLAAPQEHCKQDIIEIKKYKAEEASKQYTPIDLEGDGFAPGAHSHGHHHNHSHGEQHSSGADVSEQALNISRGNVVAFSQSASNSGSESSADVGGERRQQPSRKVKKH